MARRDRRRESDLRLQRLQEGGTSTVRPPALMPHGDRVRQRLNQPSVKTSVGDASDWEVVDTGEGFSCALEAGGAAFCWGANGFGNLGIGATGTPVLTPVQVVDP